MMQYLEGREDVNERVGNDFGIVLMNSGAAASCSCTEQEVESIQKFKEEMQEVEKENGDARSGRI